VHAYPTLERDTIALLDQANGAYAPALSTLTLEEAKAGATEYLASTAANWPANDRVHKQTVHVPAAAAIYIYMSRSAERQATASSYGSMASRERVNAASAHCLARC
jgi:hypothetical protein